MFTVSYGLEPGIVDLGLIKSVGTSAAASSGCSWSGSGVSDIPRLDDIEYIELCLKIAIPDFQEQLSCKLCLVV